MYLGKKRHWAKIRSDHVDEEGICTIEAWLEGMDTTKPGITIAYVDTVTGRVMYEDPDARIDAYAQEAIREAFWGRKTDR